MCAYPPKLTNKRASLCLIWHALHAQHHLQRHSNIDRVAAGRRFIEAGRDMLLSRSLTVSLGQMLERLAHVGERR
jgi:hypothetical protein